jgi:dihydropteroate synthase
MGIVNVTPDSFFPEARTADVDAAIARGRDLFIEGAAIVDVGGESTRPGATPVELSVELERTAPVVAGLRGHGRISIDTTKADVASACVAAGATLINDISGTLSGLAGELKVGWVAMHAQGNPQTMQLDPHYDDVIAEISAWFVEKAAEARSNNVQELWLDPGIGFGKTEEHNWTILRHCDELAALAHSLGALFLVGSSRKGFLGDLGHGPRLAVEDRLAPSLATAVAAMEAGADFVRVHDVLATVQAARIKNETMAVS